MLLSIVLAVVVFGLVSTICSFFENGCRPLKKQEVDGKTVRVKVSQNGLIKAGIIGLEVGLINWLAPKVAGAIWLAPIFLIAMLAISGYLIWWFYQEGESLKELFAFSLLIALVYLTTMSAAWMTTGIFTSPFMVSLITLIPKLVWIFSFGFFVVSMLFFRQESAETRMNAIENQSGTAEAKEDDEEDKEKEAKKAKGFRIAGWVAMILVAIILLLMLIFNLNWGSLKGPGNSGTTPPQTTWYGFYNPSLLRDNDASNDYNFGYNLAEFESKKLTADDYDADLRKRMEIDPKLGAATMAWMDANVGTRFLGVFYDECKGNWATTMNTAAERWINDEAAYRESLKAFFAFLDTAEVDLKEGKGIEDQMYMNPHTATGIPDIIVMKTDQETGLFLVYNFRIKGNIFTVMYRTECGYQPTNVEKVMNIKPQDKPDDDTDDDKPGGKDPDDDTPKKDPTKGTQGEVVGKNDNPGPGKDTNNGVGAQTSSEQQDEASINLPTYKEYEKVIDNLEDINDTQKEGGDKNTPTVTPDKGTNVDSNADEGTGNGGIDKPTVITDPAKTADGDNVDSDGAGEAWGGPPDA